MRLKVFIDKYKMYFIIIIVLFFIILGIILNNKENVSVLSEDKDESLNNNFSYNILIKGEVINPNVYYYDKEMYLFEIINNAGGFTNYALCDDINLIELISSDKEIEIYKDSEYNDKVKIKIIDYCNSNDYCYVYIVGDYNIYKFDRMTSYKEIIWRLGIDTSLISLDSEALLEEDLCIDYSKKLLNINKASFEDLKSLNVLNTNVINNILKYIEENGSIDSFNELDEVNGIGLKTLEKLDGLICFK